MRQGSGLGNPMDASVVSAVAAAVEADPGNFALRRHYAGLLVQACRWADSLEEAKKLLAVTPDDLAAMEIAAQAARELGDADLAKRYERLLAVLRESGESASRKDAGEPASERSPKSDGPAGSAEAAAAEIEEKEPSPRNAKLLTMPVIEGGMSDSVWSEEAPKVTLHDVAGMAEVKRRLHLAFLAPLKNPEVMKMYGKTLRGGLMLYGPPGCGKTFIARAVAGEMGARFISVGLSDVLDMYLGQSEKNLHEIFENARRSAPCVLFFDEIDALGRKRTLLRHSAGRDVINQLLAEMDSIGSNNRSVFILAATNHPWDVDSALRRPGRLDRTLLVLPPDQEARRFLFERCLNGRPVEGVDIEGLAQRTEGYSGADIVHLCESAVELAMEESLSSGETRLVRNADFKKPLKEVKASTAAWLETAKNYALFANEGGAYDELLAYLRSRRMV